MSEGPQKKFTAYFREIEGNELQKVSLRWGKEKIDLTGNHLGEVVAEGEDIIQIFQYGEDYEFRYNSKNRTL